MCYTIITSTVLQWYQWTISCFLLKYTRICCVHCS